MADASPKTPSSPMLVDTVSDIGSVIKARRAELGWTMVHLAVAAGVSRFFVADLENGKRTCQFDKILDVLAALDLKIEVRRRTQFKAAG